MTGIEPLLAAAAAAAESAAAGVGSAVTGLASGVGSAGAAAGSAAAGATQAGITTAGALEAAGTAASLAGTGAQLLQDTPNIKVPKQPTIDDATREANQQAELLKRKGRGALLLADGGRGLAGSPSLGASAQLGS